MKRDNLLAMESNPKELQRNMQEVDEEPEIYGVVQYRRSTRTEWYTYIGVIGAWTKTAKR